MARLRLTKAELARQRKALQSYRRFLPSLDLKRRQLMAERNRAGAELVDIRRSIERQVGEAGQVMPMLADATVELHELVRVESVTLAERNVLGVRLPVVERIETGIRRYGWLARPHWVDLLAERLAVVLRLEIEQRVAERRLQLLEAALVKVTQRVNLFDKLLIPRAEDDVRRIRIHLGDAERAAVVIAKIAKGRQVGRPS